MSLCFSAHRTPHRGLGFRNRCARLSRPALVMERMLARLVRKPSHLIAIRLMPSCSRPSTIFLTDFGCNEIVFFSGVSWVTFFAPAKKVTRSPKASESSGFLRHQDQRQGTGFPRSRE